MLTLREREKKRESVVERFGRRKAAKRCIIQQAHLHVNEYDTMEYVQFATKEEDPERRDIFFRSTNVPSFNDTKKLKMQNVEQTWK